MKNENNSFKTEDQLGSERLHTNVELIRNSGDITLHWTIEINKKFYNKNKAIEFKRRIERVLSS